MPKSNNLTKLTKEDRQHIKQYSSKINLRKHPKNMSKKESKEFVKTMVNIQESHLPNNKTTIKEVIDLTQCIYQSVIQTNPKYLETYNICLAELKKQHIFQSKDKIPQIHNFIVKTLANMISIGAYQNPQDTSRYIIADCVVKNSPKFTRK